MRSHTLFVEEDGWSTKVSALWWGLVFLISSHFAFDYLKNNVWFLNMNAYVSGVAASPFQQRILVGWIIGAAERLHLFNHALSNVPPLMHDVPGKIVFLVSFASMFGAILCTAGSIRVFTGNIGFSRWSALLVCYMAYFPLCLSYAANFILPYDVPSLFFLSFCLFCTVRDKPWLYLPVFAVATCNRESICMATLFFAGWYLIRRVRSRGFVVAHVAAQVVLWLVIRALIHRHYPGVGSEVAPVLFRFFYNLRILVNPLQWPTLFSLFGYAWILLVVWRKYIRDPYLIFGLAVTGVWMVLLLGLGVYNEIRIFAELTSFVSVAVAVTLWHRLEADFGGVPVDRRSSLEGAV